MSQFESFDATVAEFEAVVNAHVEALRDANRDFRSFVSGGFDPQARRNEVEAGNFQGEQGDNASHAESEFRNLNRLRNELATAVNDAECDFLVFRNLVDSSQNSRNGVKGTLAEVFGRHVTTLTRRANAWSNALERFSADPNA
jgi:hypothetical protein